MEYYKTCVLCSKRKLKPKDRRPLCGEKNKELRDYLEKFFFVTVDENHSICNKCRMKYYQSKHDLESLPGTNSSKLNSTNVQNKSVKDDEKVNINIAKAGSSHSRCFLCKKPGPRFVTVKTKARHQIFVETGILLSKNARCCPKHFTDGNILNKTSLQTMKVESFSTSNESTFTKAEIVNLIGYLRREANINTRKHIDFSDSLSDDDYKNLTGISKADFDDLLGYITTAKNSKVRNVRNCLGIFMTKFRSGLSNRVLSTIFGMTKTNIKNGIHSIRRDLSGRFLEENIGFEHIARGEVITNKTRPIAKVLFAENECNPPAILVLDGTYLFIQKSQNFGFQRRSFNVHKKRPLVKPMMVVSTSGYIISVLGPYLGDGKNNDASILKHIVRKNVEDIKSWVQDGDVFVVDRGFRDSLDMLEELGIKAKMPSFLSKGEKQFPVLTANKTRLVTKVRWVVESANAKLKQWKFFEKTIPNTHLPNIVTYLKIFCAVINKYTNALSSPKHQVQDIELGARMLELSEKQNELMCMITNDDVKQKKSNWEPTDSVNIEGFPSISEERLCEITLGIYMVKLSKSYSCEHIEDGKYEILMNKYAPGIIEVHLQSRHTSRLKHRLWIKYDSNDILAWYCKCPAGARVVGTCAHVASVVWYLGNRQNQTCKNITDWARYLSDASEQ